MKSLAEHLGVVVTESASKTVEPIAFDTKMTVKDFCRGVLQSAEYRTSLMQRIFLGTLPPAVECMLWERAHGKVADKLEFKDTTDDVDEMNAEQCEREAMRLLTLSRQLRHDHDESTTDETNAESVH